MKYTIVTACCRPDFLPLLQVMLENQNADLRWLILVTPDQSLELHVLPAWARVIEVNIPRGTGASPGDLKMIEFMRANQCDPDRWHGFLNDDDWYEPEFFEKLGEIESPCFVVSMKRGDQIPNIGLPHPVWTLEAEEKNLHFGHVSLEQVFFLPSMIAKCGIAPRYETEATLIEFAKIGPTTYRPDVFVWFNYLQPGRWNK